MATLDDTIRRKLRYMPTEGQALLNPARLACWNWALSGLGPNPINPDTAFSYVAGYLDANALLPPFQVAGRLARLTEVRNAWRNHQTRTAVTVHSAAALQAAMDEILKVSVEANGLTWGTGVTPYQIYVYYKATGVDAIDGFIPGPNYTHWWLKIDGSGDGIETFPDSNMIDIRRPEYSTHNVRSLYLTSLQPDHVLKINNLVGQVITANHGARAHGAWVADNARVNCTICGDAFTFFTRKHHCRCCGILVCAKCSPARRNVVGAVLNPDGSDGAGSYRVCLYCE